MTLMILMQRTNLIRARYFHQRQPPLENRQALANRERSGRILQGDNTWLVWGKFRDIGIVLNWSVDPNSVEASVIFSCALAGSETGLRSTAWPNILSPIPGLPRCTAERRVLSVTHACGN
jgi:hypothetical protein